MPIALTPSRDHQGAISSVDTELVFYHRSNPFVVSGGPGSGKTTLLRELAKSGLTHASEVARDTRFIVHAVYRECGYDAVELRA